MNQQRIDAFLEDIKAVCEKHGLFLRDNGYEGEIIIDDRRGYKVADVDSEFSRATLYREVQGPPAPPRSHGVALNMEAMNAALRDQFSLNIARSLDPSPLMRMLNKP